MSDFAFELFVNGHSPRSEAAVSNLLNICRSSEFEGSSLKVVNVVNEQELASNKGVLVVPALIVSCSGHERRMIGNLDDMESLSRELARWKLAEI